MAPSVGIAWRIQSESGGAFNRNGVALSIGIPGRHPSEYASIYEKYKDRGFTVLGFPSNDFLWQEPGTNEEIRTFCSLKYNVTFDMFAKVSVRGQDASLLYKDLTSKKANGAFGGAIKWNFTKFLVARDGAVVARFGPSTKPDDPEVVGVIEAELAKTP